ncbi:hypothetical protein KAS79_00735 [Candidatus Parcubacteria bacterium]|nr:hypothetical protein [Candidatus Parcubacteria bacterium]
MGDKTKITGKMTEERKWEIGYKALKEKFKSSAGAGLIGKNVKREVGNISQAIEVDIDELMEFAEIMTRELVDETYSK